MSKVVAALGALFFLLAIMLIVGMDLSFDHALLLLSGLLLVAVFGSMAAYQQIKNREKNGWKVSHPTHATAATVGTADTADTADIPSKPPARRHTHPDQPGKTDTGWSPSHTFPISCRSRHRRFW